MKLGEMLIKKDLITSEQLDKALAEQKKSGEPVGKVLVKKGFLKEEELLKTLSEQLEIPHVDLKEVSFDPEAIKKIPPKFVLHYKIIPIKFKAEENVLTVATSDPLKSMDDLKVFLDYSIEPVLASEEEIVKMVRKYYGVGAETVEGIMDEKPGETVEETESVEEVEDLEKMAGDASIIKLVNQVLLEAYEKRATDIHIEPFRGKMKVRYRIDGVLYDANVPEGMERFYQAIVSRIKIMSNLNIVERRLPQDGRATVRVGGEELDLRISIVPTRHGEGIVIRILPTKMIFDLDKLGLDPKDSKILQKLIKRQHGIIFATGPTGSGKTTTLYTCLNKIKSDENKILTIEDPIEYELEGVMQVQVNPGINFTFANALRSILRHDPDIMMVGEVRDLETAELAIRTALTGHLILSTLHTNSAAGGVSRLLDMGVEPYLLASSVEAFIAQRLVRVICPDCKKEDPEVPEEIKEEIAQKTGVSDFSVYKGEGCEECNFTGFKGRTAIYEILLVDKEIKELILDRASTDEIHEKAVDLGMKTLRVSGWEKVISGKTTPDEVMKVTQI